MKIDIVVVAGVRSQYMKMASFQRWINKWNNENAINFNPIYINSGQHYDEDLAGSFIKELNVQFDYDLTGSYKSRRPVNIYGEMIVNVYEILEKIRKPINWFLVFGDANTTSACAIAASKFGVPVVHVEAGVRTGFRSQEETNRIIVDHMSSLLFVSSKRYIELLRKEGFASDNIIFAGDLIKDLVIELSTEISMISPYSSSDEYILASLHREENLNSDDVIRNIMYALSHYQRKTIFITHPRTRKRLGELNLLNLPNIEYVTTLSYLTTLATIKAATFIVTDSGAFQREAFYLQKRCLTRQDEPHWASLIEGEVHRNIGRGLKDIQEGFDWIENALRTPYPSLNDFGDGDAGKIILQALAQRTS